MMLRKRYQNFDIFPQNWTTYLKWYTSTLGLEYLKIGLQIPYAVKYN